MAAEMSERRQFILKLVIQEFIERPEPVASKLLVQKYGLNVSSATVRNELAALEELGYLTHLHTSDGRVPTDAGYRYFVERASLDHLGHHPGLSVLDLRGVLRADAISSGGFLPESTTFLETTPVL